jgi:hypothetical protein
VIRDREALAELFEDGAVLATEDSSRGARGGDEIARLTHYLCERNHTYLAEPSPVLQAGDTGLIVAKRGINVVRRGTDGAWRYAIAPLSRDDRTAGRTDDAIGPPPFSPPRLTTTQLASACGYGRTVPRGLSSPSWCPRGAYRN